MISRLSLLLCVSAGHVSAETPFLALPLQCELGRTCVIEDYVDADPGPGRMDYTCGLKSREGHRGTDIALTDFTAMERGVPVLAAARGQVEAVRDAMPDTPVTEETRDAMAGQECGNAVRLNHGNGYWTIYCHMRRGSIAVHPGEIVEQGDQLGLVGLSGLTNYPHVHMTVLGASGIVDPFDPHPDDTCGPSSETLWLSPPTYHDTGLFTAAITDHVPDMEAVISGTARRRVLGTGDPLVLYGHMFKAQAGDVVRFSMTGPEGPVFSHETTLERGRAQQFRAFGKRAPETGWAKGDYRGYVTLVREGELLAVRHADIIVK